MFAMRFFLINLISIFLLFGCESNPSKPVSNECKQAKGQYQMCYGSCMASTPGDAIYVMSKCGRQCKDYIPYACR